MALWLLWVIAGVILIIAEMTTFTFYLLWLSIGAFAAALTSLYVENWLWQVLVGGVVALVLSFSTRALTRNVRHSAKGFFDPYERIVGKTGVVTEPIAPGKMGQVRIGSDVWSASAAEVIEAGESVAVVERNSTILQVQKLKENG